jgi:hypothetical protein
MKLTTINALITKKRGQCLRNYEKRRSQEPGVRSKEKTGSQPSLG